MHVPKGLTITFHHWIALLGVGCLSFEFSTAVKQKADVGMVLEVSPSGHQLIESGRRFNTVAHWLEESLAQVKASSHQFNMSVVHGLQKGSVHKNAKGHLVVLQPTLDAIYSALWRRIAGEREIITVDHLRKNWFDRDLDKYLMLDGVGENNVMTFTSFKSRIRHGFAQFLLQQEIFKNVEGILRKTVSDVPKPTLRKVQEKLWERMLGVSLTSRMDHVNLGHLRHMFPSADNLFDLSWFDTNGKNVVTFNELVSRIRPDWARFLQGLVFEGQILQVWTVIAGERDCMSKQGFQSGFLHALRHGLWEPFMQDFGADNDITREKFVHFWLTNKEWGWYLRVFEEQHFLPETRIDSF